MIRDTIKPQTIISGFRKCGLHPFTEDAINFKDMMIKSTANELHSTVQVEEQCKDGIDQQKFFEWIEKSIPVDILHDFQTSGDVWVGSSEHKSLFGFWQKQLALAKLSVPMEVDKETCQQTAIISPDKEQVLTIDYESIPTVELEAIEYVPIEDIIVIDNCQETLVEGDGDETVLQHTGSTDDTNEFGITVYAKDYCSDDDCSSSNTQDNDSSSDDDGTFIVDQKKEPVMDQNLTASSPTADNDEVGQRTTVFPQNTSHIPPNTPAAFAKVLFFPGEKHLQDKKKRLLKKRKVPAVYTSEQYSEYLREKQKEKEEKENLKIQKKMEREEAKQKKDDEKKKREVKRAEQKEAMAIKKAELASKKAEAANKRAEKKAVEKYSASAKKRKIEVQN